MSKDNLTIYVPKPSLKRHSINFDWGKKYLFCKICLSNKALWVEIIFYLVFSWFQHYNGHQAFTYI